MSLTLIGLCQHAQAVKLFVDEQYRLQVDQPAYYLSVLRVCPACDGHNFSYWPSYQWEPLPLAIRELIEQGMATQALEAEQYEYATRS